MMKCVRTVLMLSAIGLLAGCSEQSDAPVTIGGRAPSFSLKSVGGETITSRSLEGQAVVLNFWATWCAPCLKDIPDLKALAADSNVKVIGIALDEDGARAVQPFVERHGMNYTILLGDQELFQRFNGYGIPYTVVLDRSSKVVSIYRGPVTREALERDLRSLNQGA